MVSIPQLATFTFTIQKENYLRDFIQSCCSIPYLGMIALPFVVLFETSHVVKVFCIVGEVFNVVKLILYSC